MVVEVMGRNTGWIALAAGMSGGADVILVPEAPTPIEEVCDRLRRRHELGRGFSIVVVAEGYPLTRRSGEQEEPIASDVDPYGYARLGGIGQVVADEITKATGYETRVTVLGHTSAADAHRPRPPSRPARPEGRRARGVGDVGSHGRRQRHDVVDVALEEAVRERQAVPASWIAAGGVVA